VVDGDGREVTLGSDDDAHSSVGMEDDASRGPSVGMESDTGVPLGLRSFVDMTSAAHSDSQLSATPRQHHPTLGDALLSHADGGGKVVRPKPVAPPRASVSFKGVYSANLSSGTADSLAMRRQQPSQKVVPIVDRSQAKV
jgi:hypothetical protein